MNIKIEDVVTKESKYNYVIIATDRRTIGIKIQTAVNGEEINDGILGKAI